MTAPTTTTNRRGRPKGTSSTHTRRPFVGRDPASLSLLSELLPMIQATPDASPEEIKEVLRRFFDARETRGETVRMPDAETIVTAMQWAADRLRRYLNAKHGSEGWPDVEDQT